MPLTRVDGDFTQVSNIVRVTVPLNTYYLLQEDGFELLQEDGFNILTYVEPPITASHQVFSNGGGGSGAQEPSLVIFFGAGDTTLTPAGSLRVEGGGLGYTDALLLDGVSITGTPNLWANYGTLIPGEWLAMIPGVADDYELRVTVIFGIPPDIGSSSVPGAWVPFSSGDLAYYLASTGLLLAGIWQFDIRDVATQTIKLSVTFDLTMDFP